MIRASVDSGDHILVEINFQLFFNLDSFIRHCTPLRSAKKSKITFDKKSSAEVTDACIMCLECLHSIALRVALTYLFYGDI